MGVGWKLFSFQGRLNRQPYWLAVFGVSILWLLAYVAIDAAARAEQAAGNPTFLLVLRLPAVILMWWVSFALGAKRLHDRDKSGWMMAFAAIPIIGTIWFLIQAVQQGTEGPNRFGPDPLDPDAPVEMVATPQAAPMRSATFATPVAPANVAPSTATPMRRSAPGISPSLEPPPSRPPAAGIMVLLALVAGIGATWLYMSGNAALILGGLQNLISPQGVVIRITDVVPGQFQNGVPAVCYFSGAIENNSKQHLEALTVDIGPIHIESGAEAANTKDTDLDLANAALDAGKTSCVDLAQAVQNSASSPKPLTCTMTGVAEGDCQKMVSVAMALSDKDIASIKDSETLQLAMEKSRQMALTAPLAKALASLPDPGNDNLVADVIIFEDSRSWAVNRFEEGSVSDATTLWRAPDGSSRVVDAKYRFANGNGDIKDGSVKMTLYRDAQTVPCLEFWDFGPPCRPLRVPDTVPPTPPAPVEAAPAPPADANTVPDAAAAAPGGVAEPEAKAPAGDPVSPAPPGSQ